MAKKNTECRCPRNGGFCDRGAMVETRGADLGKCITGPELEEGYGEYFSLLVVLGNLCKKTFKKIKRYTNLAYP